MNSILINTKNSRKKQEDFSKGINQGKYSAQNQDWKDTSFRKHLYSQKIRESTNTWNVLDMEICNLSLQDRYLVSNLWCHKWFAYGNLIWVWLIKGIANLDTGLNGYISIHVLPDEWIQKTHPILGNQPPNSKPNLHHVIDIAPSKISRFVHVLLNGTSAPLRYQWHPTKPGRFPPRPWDVSDVWEPENGKVLNRRASKVAELIFLPKVFRKELDKMWAI